MKAFQTESVSNRKRFRPKTLSVERYELRACQYIIRQSYQRGVDSTRFSRLRSRFISTRTLSDRCRSPTKRPPPNRMTHSLLMHLNVLVSKGIIYFRLRPLFFQYLKLSTDSPSAPNVRRLLVREHPKVSNGGWYSTRLVDTIQLTELRLGFLGFGNRFLLSVIGRSSILNFAKLLSFTSKRCF